MLTVCQSGAHSSRCAVAHATRTLPTDVLIMLVEFPQPVRPITDEALRGNQRPVFGLDPVSYTHLDVYKRQLIDYNGGGSVVEWTKTLDSALKLDFDTVIPGHGAVTNKAGLLTYRNNVEKLRNRVTGLVHEGKSQDEIANCLLYTSRCV